MNIALSLIRPSPHPVRSSWDEEKMEELAQSIREQGVIVPVKVRPIEEGPDICEEHGWAAVVLADYADYMPEDAPYFACDHCDEIADWAWPPVDGMNGIDRMADGEPADQPLFELVYGHRRVEAARRAGLIEVPAIVDALVSTTESVGDLPVNAARSPMSQGDVAAVIQALIENTQREDMSVLQKGQAYRRLMEATGWNAMELQRRQIAHNTVVGRCLSYLEEYEQGTAVHLEMDQGRGPNAQGVFQTMAIRRALQDDTEAKRLVADKVAREDLTEQETEAVAQAYRDAQTDDEREAVLKVSGRHPAFERAVGVQMGVDRAEEIRERKVSKRHQENDREVAEFFDAVKSFRAVVDTMMSAVDFGKFSDEGARFAVRRIDTLIEKLQDLRGQLTNE